MTLGLALSGLCGCSVESTHTSEATLTTTVNGETNEQSFKAEAGASIGSDNSTSDNSDIDQSVMDVSDYIDEYIASVWTEDGCDYKMSLDPDRIYVHIWCEGITTPDNLDEDAFRNSVIPEWTEAMGEWRTELDNRDLKNVGVTLQYISDDASAEEVFMTMEDGELVYFVLD